MKEKIVEKLRAELGKPIVEESQVVYILSRIRKMLEIDRHEHNGKYRKLKFYCDWALHAEIDKGAKVFQKELEAVVGGDLDAIQGIFTHEIFETEFFDFLSHYGISVSNYMEYDNRKAFRKLLAEVYSDTPVMVTLEKRARITTNEGILIDKGPGKSLIEIGFRVEHIE